MKNQALFSSKNKSKKLKCRLLHLLFGALRVEYFQQIYYLQALGILISRLEWKCVFTRLIKHDQ